MYSFDFLKKMKIVRFKKKHKVTLYHSEYYVYNIIAVLLTNYIYGKYYKISNTCCLQKRLRQTAQNLIRLKQSDQGGLPCFAILTIVLRIPALITNILFVIENEKCLKPCIHMSFKCALRH